MEKNLVFGESLSIGAIKSANAGQPLRILKNEATGKLFFSCGATSGAVSVSSTVAEILEAPVVTRVTSPDSGDTFLLLHKKGSGGATEVAAL
jgi:hypothetical protein